MTVRWDAHGVQVMRPAADASMPAQPHTLTHAQVAALSNYEALHFGLPPQCEASLTIMFEGRVDMPHFRIERTLEPFNHMHPWANYTRTGALLRVGERMLRLNPQQLQCFDAMDTIEQAGKDIAARLRAWPALMDALHMPGKNHVLVTSDIPMVRISVVDQLPQNAMTRDGKRLKPVSEIPSARWAMDAGRRYYLRAA